MAKILDGKTVALAMKEQIKNDVERLKKQGICPGLAIVRMGENSSDLAYEKGAVKNAEALGIAVEKKVLAESADTAEVIGTIEGLNKASHIHGILVFRPMPVHIDDAAVREAIEPRKDVDGITALSQASIYSGEGNGFPPCTAEGAVEILKYYGIPLGGKKAVVLGRSLVIGKPVALMLLKENATVSICHSRTGVKQMEEYCKDANIICLAAGRRGIFTAEMAADGQAVIDVGINFDEEGKMCGDADFESLKDLDISITPVPGGVGAVTSAILMKHVTEAAKNG